MECISKKVIIQAIESAKEALEENKRLINEIRDKDEIISLLKEKIERLENENIGLEYKQKIPEFKIKRSKNG